VKCHATGSTMFLSHVNWDTAAMGADADIQTSVKLTQTVEKFICAIIHMNIMKIIRSDNLMNT
jgi:hypothetical protein